ncbi:uncharacterized protein [Spinacia oleracea]|uniref:CASP-like protein n=1 Tax=Spinacia oleracea TaxID=3562 RepID=A0A9R0IIY3_SPIOL|nr:uncharacterized protein LOC110789632 [Spinacia oleracea]
MKEGNVVVYVVVGFLGLAAAALAFAAEATKIKISDITVTEPGKCEYPNNPADILGYVAASLTLINQIIVSIVGRCTCWQRNGSKTSNTQHPAVPFFIISWVGSIIGIGLLLYGANLSTRQEFLASKGVCYALKSGVFAAGGVMTTVACILGIFSANRHSTPREVPYQGGLT